MLQKKITINIEIETRDVALIVQTASKFSSNIYINLKGKNVNAKSIMGIIALGNLYDEEILITADGEDEEQVIKEIAEFLKR